ncbi:MAG: endo alpha-1,4 polygalactosaminidase [Candidatus Helarchaeota archaeon]
MRKKSMIILITIIILGICIIPIAWIIVTNFYNNLNENIDYRQEMRNFVRNISAYSKNFNNNFIIIPQNGNELITSDGSATGKIMIEYMNSIDGLGREDLFYGYNNDNEPTPTSEQEYMMGFLDLALSYNKKILVIDYYWNHPYIDDSYIKNSAKNYISFAAEHRELDIIPTYPLTPYNSNNNNISSLNDAKNFLYLINPSTFDNKSHFINALKNTNYDILIIDLFFEGTLLNSSDINQLKLKPSGSKRLVLAYLSIGEAEDYRYYWKSEWNTNPPDWLCNENPNWLGNYKVKYWYAEWQNIIFGNNESYVYKIINSGFDGIYLDIIDAFEYFKDLY